MKLTKKSAPKNTLSPVPPVTLNLTLKFKCASNSMKIETMNKLLEFENFDFLLTVGSSLVSKTNNQITMFLIMEMKFYYFDFWNL